MLSRKVQIDTGNDINFNLTLHHGAIILLNKF